MTAPSKVVLKHYARVTVFGLLACSKLLFWIYFYQGGFAWNSNLALKANWHPFLMTFGMVFLYSQATVVFRTAHGVLDRKVLIAIHVGIHLVAFIISVIGLTVIIDLFRQSGASHFKSTHSILGLFAIVVYIFQFLTGFLVVIQYQPIFSKYFHMVIACITLLAASIAVTSGLAVAGNYSPLDDSGPAIILAMVIMWIFCYALYIICWVLSGNLTVQQKKRTNIVRHQPRLTNVTNSIDQ